MIPAAFEYARATSVQEASSLLSQYGDDAKLIAGGHSLIPLMRLRLAQPTVLVDINGLADLSYIRVDGDRLRVGALTRHVEIERSPVVRENLPILADVAAEVGDTQVRNRGTIGGVLAHADPAGDYGTLALMLDAEIVTSKRSVPASAYFRDIFTTALDPDELVCEVAFPAATGPHKYIKFRRRRFDWAIVAAGAQKVDGSWRVGLTNVGPTPVRATGVEQLLAQGASPKDAAQRASDGLDPPADLRGSADFKRNLARVLAQRALEQAT